MPGPSSPTPAATVAPVFLPSWVRLSPPLPAQHLTVSLTCVKGVMKRPHQRRWPFWACSEPSGTLMAEPRGLLVRPGRRRGPRAHVSSCPPCVPLPPQSSVHGGDSLGCSPQERARASVSQNGNEASCGWAVCRQGEDGADGPPFGGARAARGPVGGILGHHRQGTGLRRLAPSFRDSDGQEVPGAVGSSGAAEAPRSCKKDVGCRSPRR